MLKFLFQSYYRHQQKKKSKRFSQAAGQPALMHDNPMMDYRCFNKTDEGKYEGHFVQRLLSIITWPMSEQRKQLALKRKASRLERKRAFTDKSYSCNKPMFGKYDIQWLQIAADRLRIGLCVLITCWILYESWQGLQIFN